MTFSLEKDRHIVMVPRSFVQFCYDMSKDEKHRKELKRVLMKMMKKKKK